MATKDADRMGLDEQPDDVRNNESAPPRDHEVGPVTEADLGFSARQARPKRAFFVRLIDALAQDAAERDYS